MQPLELYIHIPFCVKKCAYCDFLSGPAGEKEKEEYVKMLVDEDHHPVRDPGHCRSGKGSDGSWHGCSKGRVAGSERL